MTEGYAIYSATLGPRGCQRFGLTRTPANLRMWLGANEEVSICVALDDEISTMLLDSIVGELDLSTAKSVGAINLSELQWGAKWPEGRWLLDGDEESCIDGPDEIFVPNESEA